MLKIQLLIQKDDSLAKLITFDLVLQNEMLEKEGIFSKEELLGMTVVELIERIGENEKRNRNASFYAVF